MTTFQLIKKGDTVFDNTQQLTGVVTVIDYKANVAEIKVEVGDEVEYIICKLFNLAPIKSKEAIVNTTAVEQGINKAFYQVKDFHVAFEHPVADKPTQMKLKRATPRSVWTGEEALVEFLHASSANQEEFNSAYDKMILGLEKAKEKSLAMNYYSDGIDTIVAQADALVDALYFIFGSFVEMNVEPDKLFDIVQNSNMSKLFTSPDGVKYAKYRESDGKILKSPEFFAPEPALKAEIERQMNAN